MEWIGMMFSNGGLKVVVLAIQNHTLIACLHERRKGTVRDTVWNLSRHSAGMAVRFGDYVTGHVHVDYKLRSGT